MASPLTSDPQNTSTVSPIPSPPPVPTKDLSPMPSAVLQDTGGGAFAGNLNVSNPSYQSYPSYPPRSSSVSVTPPTTNFSRPGARSPAPEQQHRQPPANAEPSRYNGKRISLSRQQIIAHEGRSSQTSTAPSSASARSQHYSTPDAHLDDILPPVQSLPRRPQESHPEIAPRRPISGTIVRKPVTGEMSVEHGNTHYVPQGRMGEIVNSPERSIESLPQLRYPHQHHDSVPEITASMESLGRPKSTNTLGSGSNSDGARQSIHRGHLSAGANSPGGSPLLYPQNHHRTAVDNRPTSYIDLLQTPYALQVAPVPTLDNSFLQRAVGSNASLLSAAKTLEMYRSNVKKTNDSAVQYEFAIFLVQTAMELPEDAALTAHLPSKGELYREARTILQRLADRSYPFAQYYLADGYSSGLFNKGKEDYDKAFPLFVAASKRGHAEAGYRAALCYEFGWGCRRDFPKAVKFFEMAASKNHPGAATRLGLACIQNTMGLSGQYRQGVKWLKRAAESADAQYNAAPYELAKLHEHGFGDDIFKDEEYAAQLFTKSADLGHPGANIAMGRAYEHGELGCPKDPGLSIHYYTMAAECGDAEGMMALCAWYLFGAEPVLEQNENEAFEWAKKAADMGFSKAEYAVGYFKEAGIGCQQSSLDANMWYWRAAQQGDERAKQRMAVINQAVSGGTPSTQTDSSTGTGSKSTTKKGLFSKLGR